ncbi:MAG: sulfite exporter TauE/SafE family protein, partial [Oceanobacter sp.]
LALFVSPMQAAAIMLPLLIVMDMFSVKAWWGQQRNDLLKMLLPAAVVGIAIGWALFGWLDENMVKVALGLMSILFAAWSLLKKGAAGESQPASSFWAKIAGAMTGFTSFLAHAGGPPLNMFLLPLKLPRAQFLATVVMCISLVNLIKLIPYAALGQLNTDNLLIGLVLMPLAWVGVRTGLWIQTRINDKLFYRIMFSLLGLVGLKLIWDGLQLGS